MSFTLRYTGMQFGSSAHFNPSKESEDVGITLSTNNKTDSGNKAQAFGHQFSNIGSLVMRYQLGQKQRAALIQEVAFQNYNDNLIQKPAIGNDQENLFKFGSTQTSKTTASLAEHSHATLGRGKVFNERRQPLIDKNKQKIGGEALIWDIIHSVVWSVALNFASQLSKQGFFYIESPPNDNPEKHKAISEALSKHEFTIKDGLIHVCEEVLKTIEPNKLAISLDPDKKSTFQENRFIISSSDPNKPLTKGPLGWLMHSGKETIISDDLLEDSIRIIKIGISHFHQLSKSEQMVLMAGRLSDNGQITVSQNAVFNGLFSICIELNKEYNFDPEKLLGNSLNLSYKRVSEHLKDPRNLDDFLTGVLLTEMTQPLFQTLETSERQKIPQGYTASFPTNNAKAFAYAFDVKDSNGKAVFRPNDERHPTNENPNMTDVFMNGNFALPALSSGKHSSAILSTAILVAEQMLIEQFLRQAINNDNVEDLLKEFIDDSPEIKKLALQIKDLVSKMKKDERGPVLGLQYDYCEPLINLLRKSLRFDKLIQLTDKLDQEGVSTQAVMKEYEIGLVTESPFSFEYDERLDRGIEKGLRILYRLGKIMQDREKSSPGIESSRGINAGLIPLISKIAPDLSDELNLSNGDETFQVPAFTEESVEPHSWRKTIQNWAGPQKVTSILSNLKKRVNALFHSK